MVQVIVALSLLGVTKGVEMEGGATGAPVKMYPTYITATRRAPVNEEAMPYHEPLPAPVCSVQVTPPSLEV